MHNIKILELCQWCVLCIFYRTSHRIQCGYAMVCYKKYLKHLINLAQVSYSLVIMLTHTDLRSKIKGIGILKILQSPSSSSTEKALRLWLKDKNILFLLLGSSKLSCSSSIFVTNVSNQHWSPGAFQALVPRSEHKWSATVYWKHSCRWLYIYVHTYIDQSTGKNI